MSAALTGTQGEDRSNYTREESKAIRQRSLRLLGSLVTPLRAQIVLAAIVLVISTALRECLTDPDADDVTSPAELEKLFLSLA